MAIQVMTPPSRGSRRYTDVQLDEIAQKINDGKYAGDSEPLVPKENTRKSENSARSVANARAKQVLTRLRDEDRVSSPMRIRTWKGEDGNIYWAVGPDDTAE